MTVFLPSRQVHLQGEYLLNLGIKPHLIYGAENEPDARPEFEEGCHALGFNPVFGDVTDLIRAEDIRGRIKYISLDFDSQFFSAIQRCIPALTNPSSFILALNVQGRREDKDIQQTLVRLALLTQSPGEYTPQDFVRNPRTNHSYRDVQALLRGEDLHAQRKEERERKFREFREADLKLQQAREKGLAHGLRQMFGIVLNPRTTNWNYSGCESAAEVTTELYIGAAKAFDRFIESIKRTDYMRPFYSVDCFESLTYELIKFSVYSTRYLEDFEMYRYVSTGGAKGTPMFSMFAKVAPLYYTDQSSLQVANFFRALVREYVETGTFPSILEVKSAPPVQILRKHLAPWRTEYTENMRIMGTRHFVINKDTPREASMSLHAFHTAIMHLLNHRETWIHDDEVGDNLCTEIR